MFSVTFSGTTLQEVADQAKQFTLSILGPTVLSTEQAPASGQQPSEVYGYRPAGVGSAERAFCPVDDGSEWDDAAVADWLGRLTPGGRRVVEVLARGITIDPRAEAKTMRWRGPQWGGVWTGPRRQAGLVRDMRRLKSWPYGHTYMEPRRVWMHPNIAERVLRLLGNMAGAMANSSRGQTG